MKSYVIPGTDERLYEGAIVVLAEFPEIQWVVHYGWYMDNGEQKKGWYLNSIPDNHTRPLTDSDLVDIKIISNGCPCPPPPCPPTPGGEVPFTRTDKDMLDRAFITVDTIQARDQLDIRYIPEGKLIRVNDVGGEVKYYQWNAQYSRWDTADFAEDVEVLSERLRWHRIGEV